MFAAFAITIILVTTSIFLHYEALRLCNEALPGLGFVSNRAKVLVAMGAALVSHIFQIALYATGFYFLQHHADVGRLAGNFSDAASSFFFFSTETYTSLGFGDVYPVGPIRLVAGMEALTGLLMISWTASFTYLEMSRYWREAARGKPQP